MTDDEKLAVAAAYTAASRSGDAEALASLCEAGAVSWHNYDDDEVDVERTGRTLRWLHRTMPDVAWTDVAVLPTSSGFVWQAVLTGTAPGGAAVRAHTCVVVTLSDAGLVARTEEYLDPAALQALTS